MKCSLIKVSRKIIKNKQIEKHVTANASINIGKGKHSLTVVGIAN